MTTTTGAMSPAELHQWELVRAAQAGNTAAYGELYRQLHPRLLTMATRRLAGNHDTAEDIVQDVFVRAFVHLERLDAIGRPVAAWFATIMLNAVCDYWRSAEVQRRDPQPVEYLDVADHDLVDDQVVAADEAARAVAEIHGAMAALTKAQREVVAMRLDGLAHEEIAAATGTNVGRTKALHHRACRSMARHITGSRAAAGGDHVTGRGLPNVVRYWPLITPISDEYRYADARLEAHAELVQHLASQGLRKNGRIIWDLRPATQSDRACWPEQNDVIGVLRAIVPVAIAQRGAQA